MKSVSKAGITKWQLKHGTAVMTVLALTFWYIGFFYDRLLSADWLFVGNFSRIVVPDTFLYRSLASQDSFWELFLAATVKNSLSSSVMWWIASFDWLLVAAINALLLFLIGLYMAKIAVHFGVDRKKYQKAILLFTLMPASVMYSVGALKELPTALLLLIVIHALLSRNHKCFVIASFFLVLVRYQLIAILLFVGMAYISRARSLLRIVVISLVCVSAAYPFLSSIPWLSFEATQEYRESYGGGGVGQYVEYIRDTIPVLSAVAVFTRVVQSLFEPIISFVFNGFSLMEGKFLNLYGVSQFVTVLILTPSIFMFFRRLGTLLLRSGDSLHVQFLFGFVVAYLVVVGGFSFIHHRYLYPVFPLVIIASLIPIEKIPTQTAVYSEKQLLSWRDLSITA